jgi:hypothetical protein
VGWLAACIALRVVGAVLVFLRVFFCVKFAQSSSHREAKADTSRNLPNPAGQQEAKKHGFTARNTLFALQNHWSSLKNGRVPYLGLKLTMHVLKNQIHLVR